MSAENTLIQAGEQILERNQLPQVSDDLTMTLSNAQAGNSLLLLGMATKNAKGLKRNMEFMDLMEERIFTPKALKGLNLDQIMTLNRENRKTADFRFKFMQAVEESVDKAEIQVDIAANDKRIKSDVGFSQGERRIVRERLVQTLSKTYVTQNSPSNIPKSAKEIPLEEVETFDDEV